jgi:tetratricopeptide (TPR) repeat protein
MRSKSIILILIVCMYYTMLPAQTKPGKEAADENSLRLYNAQNWSELLKYGNSTIASGIDFPLLRMRTGYAALALGRYSRSLIHYEKTYKRDHDNQFALYYTYLNNVYLNNITSARYYAGKMPKSTRAYENIKWFKVSSVNMTYSYKLPSINIRGNGQFGSMGVNVQLGYRLEIQQMIGFFNQTINESNFLYVTNSSSIAIAQKEYYAKIIFACSGRVSLTGGYHYIYTPFNNYTFNNNIGFAGIKYAGPYMHLEGILHNGKLSDSTFNQYDIKVTSYPLGNTRLYTITRGSYVKEYTLTQILGVKISKNIWLEGNTTLGAYKILLDNDGMYLFNDVDTKKFKAGMSTYILLTKKIMFSFNYNFEKKLRYGTTSDYFYQHSLTTGLLWNF